MQLSWAMSATPELLFQIFERLPTSVQCLTVSMVGKQWRQRAAEKLAAVEAEWKQFQPENGLMCSNFLCKRLPLYQLPTWWVKREWHGLGVGQQQQVMRHAAYYGNMDTLAFAFRSGFPLVDGVTRAAAAGGQLTALQWARAHGAARGKLVCTYVARNGYLSAMQWARLHGCEWDKETCLAAARERGAPGWDEWTCYFAAFNGDLPMLQWSREQGWQCVRMWPAAWRRVIQPWELLFC